MNYQNVKATIDANIRANGQQLITGPVLNGVLTTIIDGLGIDPADFQNSETDKLQIANRVNGSNTTGMGYKILRSNKTFASQVTDANTIYEIRDNYALSGNFSLPANCILFFNGGKISGAYNLVGNNTTILGAVSLDGVTLTGTYTNDSCDLSWWGCSTTANVDNSDGVTLALGSTIRTIVVRGKYGLSKPVNIALGAHLIIGGSVGGFLQDGFVANSDFAPITISVRGNTYTASGVLYHYYDQDACIRDLNINASWVAKYAIEHIAGYSSIAMENVHIKNAKIAGVLQYACEKPIWKHVQVWFSHVGFYVSKNRINESNVLDFSGSVVGEDNMVTLYDCRALKCNYGMILSGGTNTSLDNCETGYNALAGLVLNGRIKIKNFYSEGDAIADFYLDANGEEINNALGKGYVPEALINDNIDGFTMGTNTLLYGGTIYFRAPIVAVGGDLSIHDAIVSLKPRSHALSNVTEEQRELPTERTATGVDGMIILRSMYRAKIDGDINLFRLTNDTGVNPRHLVIMGNPESSITLPSLDFDYINLGCEKDPVFVATSAAVGGNNGYYLVGDIRRKRNPQTILSSYPYVDYSPKLQKARYGQIASPFDIRTSKLMGFYDGVPLYKRETSRNSYNLIYIKKTDLESVFGSEDEIKFRVIVHLPVAATTRMVFRLEFRNAEYTAIKTYNNDNSANSQFAAGYYDIVFVCPINYLADDTWDKISLSLVINNEASIEAYVSDYLIYNVSSPLKMPVLLSNVLESGTTAKRPTANAGQTYFDTTLNKMIVFNGTDWVNMDGTPLA